MLDLIQWRARKTPNRPALFFNGRWYSYLEMDARANRLANRLRDLGVQQGDRVGIIAHNHLVHFDLLLAAPKLGFIYAPFNYRLSQSELAAQCREANPTLVFADSRHQSLAESLGLPWTRLSDYRAWLAAGAETLPAPPERPLTDCDTHMLLFTGGSTGLAKGALLPYRQVLLNARHTADSWGLTDADCTIQCTPCFHAGINVLSLPLLYRGGRVVLMSNFDADEYLGHVALHRASVLFMVPTMYKTLVDYVDFDAADLSSVRWAISGGAPCPMPVRHAYAVRGVRFKQGFGMTEAGVNCFTMDLDAAERKPESVGKPMTDLDAVIRKPDGTPVPTGEVGELTLKGPQMFSGYLGRPEETAKLLRDGWLWTGDLARQDSEGDFFIAGRRKEMFISGGENVYPVEVETALYRCEDVMECCVMGLPDAQWGEAGLAVVVLQEGVSRDAEALRQQLRGILAAYKVPKHFYFLAALPKGGSGKVQKSELRRLYELSTAVHGTGQAV